MVRNFNGPQLKYSIKKTIRQEPDGLLGVENYLQWLLLGQFLLDQLGQGGNDLEEVAHDAVVRDVEDGSGLILVDGNDKIGFFHAG